MRLRESNSTKDLREALKCFENASSVNKDYSPPKSWIRTIKEKIIDLEKEKN